MEPEVRGGVDRWSQGQPHQIRGERKSSLERVFTKRVLPLILAGLSLLAGLPFGKCAQFVRTTDAPPKPTPDSRLTPDSRPTMTLRIYNYAHLNLAFLTSAEQVTTAIFKKAGLETAWVDCPLSHAEFEKYPACHSQPGTADFALRLLTASMAAKAPTTNDPLGFAQYCRDDEPGCVANIFYFKVDQRASQIVDEVAFQGKDARVTRILGHAMAHEVGHLLLGPNAHSPDGIMRGVWSPDDLRLMSWTYLFFTPSQSDQLRASLVRRTKPEVHSQSEPICWQL